MIDRVDMGELAVLVHPEFQQIQVESGLDEFKELVSSSGIDVNAVVTSRRHRPDPGTCIGRGKIDELAAVLEETCSNLVLFNHSLSPVQERNLEKLLNVRVHDRTTLILDIFAQRARSHEGKLQVELAQLKHLSTRLVRGWTHLERQKGGIGLRGPGETQLETDRRLLGKRIKTLHARLEKLNTQRTQGRKARRRHHVPVVSMVGYTNAGKSTLFNALSGSDIYVADQLFATLDPTLRKISNDKGRPFILADTVGFIQNLPHDLVAAFHSTLEEIREADLLLHVLDASDPHHNDRIEQVQQVIEEIGAEQVPQILVHNKIDLTDMDQHVLQATDNMPARVWLSSISGQGIEALLSQISAEIDSESQLYQLDLSPDQGQLRAMLYEWGVISQEKNLDTGHWCIEALMNDRERHQVEVHTECVRLGGEQIE